MKKALVVFLAVAMTLCFGATALAATGYSDISTASEPVQTAIAKVSALSIVEGYEDGTFRPGNTITRAEFAKMTCVSAGLAAGAANFNNMTSSFSDVATGIWYTGWVNQAAAAGYVKGYEDGTFRPNSTISYGEVATVLLRLLGYTDQLGGTWPSNYVNQAIRSKITENTSFATSSPATRGDVALMISAALDTNMVEYSANTGSFRDRTKEVTVDELEWSYDNGDWVDTVVGTKTEEQTYTLLEDSFDGTSVQGYVLELTIDRPEDFEYTITLLPNEAPSGQSGMLELTADEVTALADGSFYELGMKQVTVIYTENRNKNEAMYLHVDSEITEVAKVEAISDERAELDGKGYTVAKGFINNIEVFGKNDVNTTGYAYINEDGEVYLTFSDAVGGEDYFGRPLLVTKVNGTQSELTVYDRDEVNYLEFDPQETLLLKDGKRIALTELAAGDVLNCYRYTDPTASEPKEVSLFVVGQKASGTVTRYTTGSKPTVTIGENKYADSATLFDSSYELDTRNDWDKLHNMTVTYVVGGDNVLRYAVIGSANSDRYGVILDAMTGGGAYGSGRLTSMEMYTNAGKKETLNLADDAEYFATASSSGESVRSSLFAQGDAVKFTVNADGEIERIYALSALDGYLTEADDGTADYKVTVTDKRVIIDKRYLVADDVVAFNIKNDFAVSKISKSSLTNVSSIVASRTDEIDPPRLEFIVEDSTIVMMVASNYNGSSSASYAIVNEIYSVGEDNFIRFEGETTPHEYTTAISSSIKEGSFVRYTLSGDDIRTISLINVETATGQIDSFSDGLMNLSSGQSLELVSDTILIYCNSEGDLSIESGTAKLTKDRFVKVQAKASPDQDELAYVIIYDRDPQIIFA